MPSDQWPSSPERSSGRVGSDVGSELVAGSGGMVGNDGGENWVGAGMLGAPVGS